MELAVKNLGVIAEARIPFGDGLNALTGETGAGKTMVVEALHLLLGAKPDPGRVRSGESEAVVEGLFVVGDDEWVLRRVVPAEGRSKAYLNGALSTSAELSQLGEGLLELHGQHASQALLQPHRQRDALDRYAKVDRNELVAARRELRELEEHFAALGGDERTRAREIDLLTYQLAEIDAVEPTEGEEDSLEGEEERLAGALEHRRAGLAASDALSSDGAALDTVAASLAKIASRRPYEEIDARLRSLHAELTDAAAELRDLAERIEPDEQRLAQVRSRRQSLMDLRRKYGSSIGEVLDFATEARDRLAALSSHGETLQAAGQELERVRGRLGEVGAAIGLARRAAAEDLADAVAEGLRSLALPSSRVVVEVSDTPDAPAAGESVQFLLATNPGTEVGPLSRVASGGELSRVMLSLRLVLSGGPPTMVFDEIDAGIGGEAATAVGRALADLARDRQVLVVTHLPQVAAFADHQVGVTKEVVGATTHTTAMPLQERERVIELSRMLSGSPDSAIARQHAEELLATAAGRRTQGAS
ncbi:MAG: DNA repair protein RecN [Microthrixaceae bacterium]|nr:DNA repair protein RecN [Microthrixaceae bacterium]